MRPRITISMPCYMRPIRTAAAIESIRRQTVEDFEAFVIGDGCPFYRNTLGDDLRFRSFNTDANYGGCGYYQTNFAIRHATGKYFVFQGNDDLIDPNHFENYLSAIEGTDLDFVWFSQYKEAGQVKQFKLKSWKIGHCALIIRTDFLKQMPPHVPAYNHDWNLIDNMIKAGAKYKRCDNKPTYHCDPYNWRFTDMDGDADSRVRKKKHFRERMLQKLGACLGILIVIGLAPIWIPLSIILLFKSMYYGKGMDNLYRHRYTDRGRSDLDTYKEKNG